MLQVSFRKPFEIDGTDTLPANVHPCTFAGGEFLQSKNVAAVWNHGHPRPKYTSVYILGYKFAGQTCYCVVPPTSVSEMIRRGLIFSQQRHIVK